MELPIVGKLVELKLKNGKKVIAIRNRYDNNGAIFEDINCIDHHEKDIKSWRYIENSRIRMVWHCGNG